jgi:GrpB-like predicted nucleotidyltransferase (UPF0157 family)
MIGLKRGTVQLVSYQPVWKRFFEEEATSLRLALGNHCLQVEHIGSTAIEGMDAKPIIDILVAVDDLRTASKLIPVLMKLGYTRKEDDDVPERIFFRKGPPSSRTHHLSLTEPATTYWKWHILFRDYLREYPEVAEQYKQLKRRLAEQYPNEGGSYTSEETSFAEKVMRLVEVRAQDAAA